MLRLQNKDALQRKFEAISAEESELSKLLSLLLARQVTLKLSSRERSFEDFNNWYFISRKETGEIGVYLGDLYKVDTTQRWLDLLFKIHDRLSASGGQAEFKFRSPPEWRAEAENRRYLVCTSDGIPEELCSIAVCMPQDVDL